MGRWYRYWIAENEAQWIRRSDDYRLIDSPRYDAVWAAAYVGTGPAGPAAEAARIADEVLDALLDYLAEV